VLLEVIDGAGNAVPSQLLPLPQSAYRLRKFYMDGDEASMTSNNYDNPPFHLVFSAVVPPLGYTTFRVRRASSANTSSPREFFQPTMFFTIPKDSTETR